MAGPRIDRTSLAVAATTAALLTVLAFTSSGGRNAAAVGTSLTIAVLLVVVAFSRAAYTGWLPGNFSGAGLVATMAIFGILAAASVNWSVLPGESAFDASRTIAYTAIVAGGALAAQLLPRRSREVLIGVLIAALVLCTYSLLSRVVPQWYPESDNFARLRLPFEYWNAVGATAVIGLVATMWVAASRSMSRNWIALSYPAGIVFILVLALTQSRGAFLATFAAVGLWLLLVPRRLRSVAWLAVISSIGGSLVIWAYNQPALSVDMIPMAQRKHTGMVMGILLVMALAAGLGAGHAIERWRRETRIHPRRRYEVGRVLLVLLAISPILGLGALATTSRGVGGTFSDATHSLVDSGTQAPANTPNRLVQTKSLRGRYWSDAFKIWDDHKWKGSGADSYSAARLPYRTDTTKVRHAHGFIPQTMADLGLLGLLTALLMLSAWFWSAARIAGAKKSSPIDWLNGVDDERLAVVSIALVAIAFGAHSTLDWTWYLPGIAAIGLVCAGWVAGSSMRFAQVKHAAETNSLDPEPTPTVAVAPARSTVAQNLHPPAPLPPIGDPAWDRAMQMTRMAGILLIGLAASWAVYQPTSAAKRIDQGYAHLEAGDALRALEAGIDAQDTAPTSDRASYLTATAQSLLGRLPDAQATLERITSQQPANPEPWIRLASFRLHELNDAGGALDALKPLFYISPNDERAITLLAEAREARVQEIAQATLKPAATRP